MGSTIRRLAFLWTLGAGGALLFTIILLSHDVNFLSALVLIRLGVIWLVFLIYSLIVSTSLNTKGSVTSADDYVSHVYANQ
jgi:DMSO reductase anchor subunit